MTQAYISVSEHAVDRAIERIARFSDWDRDKVKAHLHMIAPSAVTVRTGKGAEHRIVDDVVLVICPRRSRVMSVVSVHMLQMMQQRSIRGQRQRRR